MHKLFEVVVAWVFAYGIFWMMSGQRRRNARHRQMWEGQGYAEVNKPKRMREERDFRIAWLVWLVLSTFILFYLPAYIIGRPNLNNMMLVVVGTLAFTSPIWILVWKVLTKMYEFNSPLGAVSFGPDVKGGMIPIPPSDNKSNAKGSAKEESAVDVLGLRGGHASRRDV